MNIVKTIKSVLFSSMVLSAVAFAEQECLTTVLETAAEDEFEKIDGGLVWHTETNLIWMRCSLGQTWDGSDCLGEATKFTWQEALQISVGYEFLDSTQWRLPNIKELVSITEKSCVRPSINDGNFPQTPPDDFWTSTPVSTDGVRAWGVAFFNASISHKSKERSLHVRLVRTALPSERND
ncbi:DUF1566 domain-containing protein [Glaciecola sp. KUL10]|uniref:Lcl C-terminal domain-containing protein n=1 Tax=Glaciecola sp. (strain KUL10) TaxID=2161813 RepID=UPI000D782116|nr:DUF1566 domain-containing protein [Glaciecola sp. KUL10]GBL04824.1 hypothetical protein KUL10_21380 [Glaciecola sp. KUL10]